MAIAIDPNRITKYVLRADRDKPEPDQTRWLIAPLTAGQRAEVEDTIAVRNADGSLRYLSGSASLKTLRYGLRGWENLRETVGGPEVEYVLQGHEAMLSKVQAGHAAELAEAISELSALSGADRD